MEASPRDDPRPRKGDELVLDVDTLAYGGRGVARSNGYVVFVSGALPGDRVRARLTKSKRTFAEARTVELIRPGADRVPDRCEHGGEPCPGAPWQGLAYERQLAHKHEQVDDALRRIGDLDGFELEPPLAAAEPWRYRNKLEYSFGSATTRRPSASMPEVAGTGSSTSTTACWRPSATMRRATRSGRGRGTRGSLRRPAGARWRAAQPGRPRGATDGSGPDPPCHLRGRDRPAAGRPAHRDRGHSVGTDGPTGVLGEEYLSEELAASASGSRPSLLPNEHRDGRGPLRDRGGVRGPRGGARSSTSSAGSARSRWRWRRTPGRSGGWSRSRGDRRRRGERSRQRAGTPLRRRRGAARGPPPARARRSPDVVVVDPPRAGLLEEGRPAADRVRGEADRLRLLQPDDAGPERRPARRGGLHAAPVRPVDMFPQTPHVECVALLESRVTPMSRGFGVAAGLDPEVARAAGGPLAELGYDVDVVERPPGRARARDPRRPSPGGAQHRPRRRGDGADRHEPAEIAGRIERLGLGPGASVAWRRRRLLREAADCDAGGRCPSFARPSRGQARPRGDGAEDVRLCGRRIRRRFLHKMSKRFRRGAHLRPHRGEHQPDPGQRLAERPAGPCASSVSGFSEKPAPTPSQSRSRSMPSRSTVSRSRRSRAGRAPSPPPRGRAAGAASAKAARVSSPRAPGWSFDHIDV